MPATETICIRDARRLALARAGLLAPKWTGLERRSSGRGESARTAALAIIRRFGYLQLDTVSIAGARSHAIVLLSRLEGFEPSFAEELLAPGAALFEYWGHEACWLPLELYPTFAFRRKAFRAHPWWGDVLGEHPDVARRLRRQVRTQGPIRSIDMEGQGSSGFWDLKVAKRVAAALWSSGELAIRERRNFQRSYDLATRVIPAALRKRRVSLAASLRTLLLYAAGGHGWASTGTLADTWRLRNLRPEIHAALAALVAQGKLVRCTLQAPNASPTAGWIRPADLELAARLARCRPRADRGVLLSPFDPVLWDRARVRRLFDFDQVLEIFKPAAQRKYGYYCLPVLAGDGLVARVDLKANRKAGTLHVLSKRFESTGGRRPTNRKEAEATRTALARYAAALRLTLRE